MLNLISLLPSRWVLVWRSHRFRYGPIARRLGSEQAQAILLLAVCVRLLASKQLQPVRLVFDSSFRNEIAMRERAMTDSVERVRRSPVI